MATHAYRTRTPTVQPPLRAAGPCRVLTEAEVVALVGEAEPLLPAPRASAVPDVGHEGRAVTTLPSSKGSQKSLDPSAEFHDHLAKPGEPVPHGVARTDIGTGVPTNTPLARCVAAPMSRCHMSTTEGGATMTSLRQGMVTMTTPSQGVRVIRMPSRTVGKSDSDPRWSFPSSAPLPSLTAAFSRRRAIFGAAKCGDIPTHDASTLEASDLALAQMRHARRALEGAFAIRGDVSAAAPLSADFQTNRFTKDQRPSFADWPRWFAMRCHGTCLEPVIPDGSSCIFDKEASYKAGDYVVIWALQAGGIIVPFVKRLVMNVAPWARFPHVRGNDEISPVVMFETLNPPQTFRANASTVYGIHKCVGYAPRSADVPIGTKVAYDVEDVHWFDRPLVKKPRRARVPCRATVAA